MDEIGDAAAQNLVLGQADGLGLYIVDPDVAQVDRIEEREADGCALVDRFELGALALGLLLTQLKCFGEGLAIVDIDVDSEPVEDVPVLIADWMSADPPPARATVPGANHAGFQVVVGSGGDGAFPSGKDTLLVVRVEGFEPVFTVEIFVGEAEVVHRDLIGVGEATVGGCHPDGLGVEVCEDAVAGLTCGEGFLVAFVLGDVDGEAAEALRSAVYGDDLAAIFNPADGAICSADGEVDDDELSGFDGALDELAEDGDVLGEEEFSEGFEVGNLFVGMPEDWVGASSDGDLSGGEVHIPGCGQCALLHFGEEIVLLLESLLSLAASSDVAPEDDHAVLGWTGLYGQPGIERLGVEVLIVAGTSLVEGAIEMVFSLPGGVGELLP